MKAYQLTILVLALCHQHVSAAPRPQQLDNGPPVRYTSKYPQHPVNQGYGDNYPKYWLNEAWSQPSNGERNKAPIAPDYRTSQGYTGDQLYRNPYAPVNDQQYNIQPRNLFVPYPYAETWDNQNTRVPASERSDPEVPSFGLNGESYQPPHGFPRERGAARAAIDHYSKVAAADENKAAGNRNTAVGTEKNYGQEPSFDDMAMFKGSGGEKNLGMGSDFSGYTKEAKEAPVLVAPSDDGWSEVSYSHEDARRQLSDIPVINEQQPYVIVGEPRRRKNAALEKIEGFLGPDESWHHKRGLPSLGKRSYDVDDDEDEDEDNDEEIEVTEVAVKEVKKDVKKESEWPEHIKSKAERMMKAAEAMQTRGSKMLGEDKATAETPSTEGADDADSDASVREYDEDEGDDEGEDEEEKEEDEPKVVPVARQRPVQQPVRQPVRQPLQRPAEESEGTLQLPVQKTTRWEAPATNPSTSGPKKAPKKKNPAPVPVVPGPNKKKNQRPSPPPVQEEEDLLMSGELPERSGKTKAPKKPKSARPPPEQAPTQPQRKKPAQGAKKVQQQDNLPTQSGAKKPRHQNMKRDEVAPPHLVDTMLSHDKMKRMGKMNNMKPHIKGSTQTPSQGSGNRGNGGGMLSSGRARPSVNQDRPNKKANKSQHNKRDDSGRLDARYILGPGRAVGDSKPGILRGGFTGGPVDAEWSLSHEDREERVQELLDTKLAHEQDNGEWFLKNNVVQEEARDPEHRLVKREAAPEAAPEADADAQNRRILPCGPPVTIRRVLGAGGPAPSAHPMAVHHQVAGAAVQIPDGQIRIPHHQVGAAAVQIPDGQIQIPHHQVGAAAVQIPDGQIQIPGPVVAPPIVPQVVLPPQTVTVNVPGPVQTVERPHIVEKVVTRVETIERPIHHTQYVHQTATVFKQVPVEHTIVQNVPVHHTHVESYPVHHTVVQSVPYPVEQHHTATVVQNVPVHHTVVSSVAYPIQQTVVQKVPYPVEHTVVSSVAYPVQHTVVEKIAYPVPHTVVEKIPYPVQQTVIQSVPVPVRHTVVQSVPFKVEHTQTATAIISYPVRITLTPEAVTKIVSAPTVTQMATTVQTSVEYETVVEKATKVIERVAVPSSSPVAIHKELHGHKDVVSTYETCRNVPVTKTICVCPSCDQTEEYCGCGTFDSCSGPECSSAQCSVITEMQCVPRTPQELEAYVRARLPGEFMAQ